MRKTGTRFYTKGFVVALFVIVIVLGCAAPQKVEKGVTVLPQESTAPAVVKVAKISAETLVGKLRVTIDANSELTYTAFKLTDPLRLVLDLPNVDTTRVSEMTFAAQSPIMRITPFQFTEGPTVNSRIEIALSRLVPYQVFSDANKLFVDLEMPVVEAAAAPPTAASLPPGFEELKPAKGEQPVVIAAKPGVGPSVAIQAKPEKTPELQAKVPTIEITKPPETVGGVQSLPGVLAQPAVVSVIKNVGVAEVEGKTRITVSADKTPEFDVTRSEAPPRLTLDLKQSTLLPEAEKVITPDELATLVKQVRVFQLRRTPDGTDNVVRVLVDLMKPVKHEVQTEPEKLVLNIEHPAVEMAETPPKAGGKAMEVPLTTGIESALKKEEKSVQEEIATVPAIRAPKTGEEKEYKGQVISLQLLDEDIKNVFDVMAEVSGLNLVLHPSVTGKVTIRLNQIPWDQALDIILKMNNLNVEIEGNIMRIAPASVFQQETQQRIAQQQQQIDARRVQAELEPLQTKLITVNFVPPAQMQTLITQYFQGMVPAGQQQQRRGTITVDERTKTLIVQDIAANIKKIQEIVATLDRRTPQVLIEARIVTLTSSFRKELGINWSGQFNADPAHGNALDYRFPYTVNTPFQVNLPTVTGIGSIGPIRLGSIDDVFSLNVRLDAAEVEQKAKTLSQPKIFTQDNVAAAVNSTRTVYVAVGGDSQTPATIQAVPATLSLSVTPRISSDGYITMLVNVSNGTIAQAQAGAAPTTDVQTVNSTVTVKDSETVVIGGIFSTAEAKNLTAVPFLSKIPLIGWLFKSTNPNSTGQSELLVFLTPRILDRSLLKAEESTNISLSY